MNRKNAIYVILAIILVFSGCAAGGAGGTADIPTGPDMGTPDLIVACDAEVPASAADAEELFGVAADLLFSAIETNGYPTETPTTSVKGFASAKLTTLRAARASEEPTSISGPISWKEDIGSGSVDFTGKYSAEMSGMAELTAAFLGGTAANKSFNVRELLDMFMTGTVSAVTFAGVDGDTNTYTMSGKIIQDMYTNINMVYAFDNTGTTPAISGNYDVSVKYGLALSVRRSDGMGAKYIVSVAAQGSGHLQGEDDAPDIPCYGSLSVYDDDNALVYSIPLTYDDLQGPDEEDE